jgi:hypothetical protein
MPECCYRVTFGQVCCCAVIGWHGCVTEDSAPILRTFYGQPAENLFRWVLGKGGAIEELGEE